MGTALGVVKPPAAPPETLKARLVAGGQASAGRALIGRRQNIGNGTQRAACTRAASHGRCYTQLRVVVVVVVVVVGVVVVVVVVVRLRCRMVMLTGPWWGSPSSDRTV